ncbi:MAG: tRNA (adenosine(37)-N6)-threonylcarbamoyltransferase complex ATPase subunit type 1 TsaE [Phycisphaerales bacterium]|nr:MAG: tRNA (adenosine(37)-N6)-threonylcarbamoyltransferase complex ATPase subunit type 1 TsaE [Phycisphaerales bacterium]
MTAAQTLIIESTSVAATGDVGRSLSDCLPGGLVVALTGPLGAGKTELVKGIETANRREDRCVATSPTFTLIHEYPGRLILFHVDAYRLKSAAELTALGFDELPRSDTAVLVEWADRVASAMPDDTLWIELTPTGASARRFSFRATGRLSASCLSALREQLG